MKNHTGEPRWRALATGAASGCQIRLGRIHGLRRRRARAFIAGEEGVLGGKVGAAGLRLRHLEAFGQAAQLLLA
jgi:hypothetical protein